MTIYYSFYTSPIGKLLILAKNDRLTHLDFEQEQSTILNPQWVENNELALFQQVKIALSAYFNGESVDFSAIPLSLQGTAFQQQIWQALLKIPYGKTISYGELAQAINNPKAVRAVGGAVGSNPISIIIPCHRVLGKKGELTGFGGGLAAKRYLLTLEQIAYIDRGVEFVNPKLLKKYQTLT